MEPDLRSIRRALDDGTLAPDEAFVRLASIARDANVVGTRRAACKLLGALSGRAWDTSWEVAERAAFALLESARDADAPADRVALLDAMGLGFRNVWLVPYIHSRLFDRDEGVVLAAVRAAGGLAFPALESAIASTFLDEATGAKARAVAIVALGRMGAESAAERLATFVEKGSEEAEAALDALTEIRSRAGRAQALDLLEGNPEPGVLVAAVRYLSEIGEGEVTRTLRALARDEHPALRLAASQAMRALEAETKDDADERILAALTQRDRALRATLARRLRTLPVAAVLERAEVLFADDPLGVIQIAAEVRAPEVTRFLLRVAEDPEVPVDVRARAAGSVEADEEWERDALASLIASPIDARIRATAIQTLGAFASTSFILDRLASLADDPSPAVRGALLWALQLSARSGVLEQGERGRAEALVHAGLRDADPAVRRRAAYVAGNLEASALVADLTNLARVEPERPDIRIAAFVALGDIGSPERIADLVHLWNREDDPQALAAASRALDRALAASTEAPASAPPASLARVADRLPKLLASGDPRVRAAAARVAGLTGDTASSRPRVEALVEDTSPRVRAEAVVAWARLAGPAGAARIASALDDLDGAVKERAAAALAAIGTPFAMAHVLDFVARSADRDAALRIAGLLGPRPDDPDHLAGIDDALTHVGHDDATYEVLLEVKLATLEASRPTPAGRAPSDVNAAIAVVFPAWTRLQRAPAVTALARSLRTAEMLYASSEGSDDADLSAAIVLWMKCLEGYLHASLAPRLRVLRERSSALWELADRLTSGWPAYQRWLSERWPDPVSIGTTSVEVPLRSVPNALRDLQERHKVDAPLSVTEWSRLMVFLAVDHPAGPKNLLEVACRDGDRIVRLAHKLQALAQVRNLATHRATTDAKTLAEFRRRYYAAFDELTGYAAPRH